jgi:hypothetical protein
MVADLNDTFRQANVQFRLEQSSRGPAHDRNPFNNLRANRAIRDVENDAIDRYNSAARTAWGINNVRPRVQRGILIVLADMRSALPDRRWHDAYGDLTAISGTGNLAPMQNSRAALIDASRFLNVNSRLSAHSVGHALGLGEDNGTNNLMFNRLEAGTDNAENLGVPPGTELSNTQRTTVYSTARAIGDP